VPAFTRQHTAHRFLAVLTVFFTRALNSRLTVSSPVTVNCVDPGWCDPDSTRGEGEEGVDPLGGSYTIEQGSRQLVWAAVGGREADLKGAYIWLAEVNEPSDVVLGEAGKVAEDRVWVSVIVAHHTRHI
jgi:retinol dehydrogenase-12